MGSVLSSFSSLPSLPLSSWFVMFSYRELLSSEQSLNDLNQNTTLLNLKAGQWQMMWLESKQFVLFKAQIRILWLRLVCSISKFYPFLEDIYFFIYISKFNLNTSKKESKLSPSEFKLPIYGGNIKLRYYVLFVG